MIGAAAGGVRLRMRALVIAGAAGALPSLIWAFSGAGLLHDDWNHAASARFGGVWNMIVHRATSSPARPLTGLNDGLAFGVFGTNAAGHAVWLAVLNGVAAVLVLLVARRLFGPAVAAWVTLAWVALPNRGSTRLWIAMGPEVLAVCLLLAGILLLLDEWPLLGGLVMAAGVLSYESVVAVAVAAAVLSAWPLRSRAALRSAAVAAGPVVAAGLLILSLSPKRTDEAPFQRTTTFFAAHIGVGVWGPLAAVGSILVLAAVALAAAKWVAPGFRSTIDRRDRLVLAGAGIAFLGAVPFFPSGFPFGTDGLLDRANMVADLGTALIMGTLAWWAWSMHRVIGFVAGAAALGFVGSLNRIDLRDYRQAVRDGEALQQQLAADVPVIDRPLIVGPPMPNRGGVAQFIEYGDLGGFLRLDRDDSKILARIAAPDEDFRLATEPLRYDRVQRELTERE